MDMISVISILEGSSVPATILLDTIEMRNGLLTGQISLVVVFLNDTQVSPA